MLSFDEFRAMNNREKNRDNIKEPEANKKATTKTNNNQTESTTISFDDPKQVKIDQSKKGFIDVLGEFLENHSMQLFYIVLLILDTFGGFLELYYLHLSIKDEEAYHFYLKTLKSFSKFTSMIFSIEIFFVYLCFGLSSLFHLGYLIDLIVLCSQMYLEYYQYGCEIKILNLFRLWRPIRFLNAMITQEKQAQSRLQQELETLEEKIQKQQLEIESMKIELMKEKEAKNAVENMLVNYKEEVDTLNEALKIAAMDIAEVGQNEDELFTSEDEENEEDMTASVASKSKETGSLSTAERSKRSAKMEILRTALDGNPLTSLNESKNTFIIHEDGKFEKK